jgi:hypothetical protein
MLDIYSYGHLFAITCYFNGIRHSINRVLLVFITGISDHNCTNTFIPDPMFVIGY